MSTKTAVSGLGRYWHAQAPQVASALHQCKLQGQGGRTASVYCYADWR